MLRAMRWLMLAVMLLTAHVNMSMDGLSWSRPHASSGDEPHYLVMVHALLFDRMFDVSAAYRREEAGGPEAGAWARGAALDHHATRVGEREIPTHQPLYPFLMAALLYPFSFSPEQVEPAVGYLTLALAGLGIVLLPLPAALLLFCSSWLPYSRSYFPEVLLGLLLLIGARTKRPIVAGVCGTAAMATRPLLVLVPAVWILQRRSVPLALTTLMGGGVILLSNQWLAGRWIISGAEGWYFADGLRSAFNLLFSEVHGALLFVPWILIPLIFNWRAVLPIHVCLFALCFFGAAHGGICYGPRYVVAFLPWLAVASLDAVRDVPRRRIALVAMAAFSLSIAVAGVLHYHMFFLRGPWG